jgi:hypothetical protein
LKADCLTAAHGRHRGLEIIRRLEDIVGWFPLPEKIALGETNNEFPAVSA